jgi:hypothetical protein
VAGVQTSIYIFEHTGKPHDFQKQVCFIDFRNDGYRRAQRGITETDSPIERYRDIVQIFKNGKSARVDSLLWNLEKTVVFDEITNTGTDWNFDQHQKNDTQLTEADFMKTVSEYLAWEVGRIIKEDNYEL